MLANETGAFVYPNAKARYAKVADFLNLCKGNETNEAKVKLLRKHCVELREKVGLKHTIADYGVSEAEFLGKLDQMVEDVLFVQVEKLFYPIVWQL